MTSREPPPSGQTWLAMRRVSTLPLSPPDVPASVAAYAPADRRAKVAERIAPLVNAPTMPNPLFLRFAIEQALEGLLKSTDKLNLVLQYVEALRADKNGDIKVNLSADDMVRAAEIAAVESVRDRLVPQEVGQDHLRSVLTIATDDAPFLAADRDKKVDPAAVIEMLVSSGLLNRNRTNRSLQFAYDPAAEYLAARRLARINADARAPVRDRIAAEPQSAIARALAEIMDAASL